MITSANITCSIVSCDYPLHSRGYCDKHYRRIMRTGDAFRLKDLNSPELLFWLRVNIKSDNECWEWTGAKWKGYGTVTIKGKRWKTHRLAYTIRNGVIPNGLVVDHKCFNPSCVNPNHLRLLTKLENTLLENRKPVTYCRKGHEYTLKNTSIRKENGARICIKCNREYHRLYAREYRKKKRSWNMI